MTEERVYLIYKFRRPQTEEYVTEFFLPETCLADKIHKAKTLSDYQKNGYMCAGFVAVDKETYLNARLAQTVKDYCDNEAYREEVQRRYFQCEMSSRTFFDTMRLIDDFKWTCLSKLEQQVRRLLREDFSVQNEIAIQIYDGLHGMNSMRF